MNFSVKPSLKIMNASLVSEDIDMVKPSTGHVIKNTNHSFLLSKSHWKKPAEAVQYSPATTQLGPGLERENV